MDLRFVEENIQPSSNAEIYGRVLQTPYNDFETH
jgi:hypothetical protein